MEEQQRSGPVEIAFVGDLTDNEADLTDKILSVEPGGECTLYIDSPGGSPYCAMSLVSVMMLRRINATGIVTGECSSAALWPFAACKRRFVTPFSVLLFHPMKWQSEEHVGLAEAAEWARHFGTLEGEMDRLLAQLFGTSEAQLSRLDRRRAIRLGPRIGGHRAGRTGRHAKLALRADQRHPCWAFEVEPRPAAALPPRPANAADGIEWLGSRRSGWPRAGRSSVASDAEKC